MESCFIIPGIQNYLNQRRAKFASLISAWWLKFKIKLLTPLQEEFATGAFPNQSVSKTQEALQEERTKRFSGRKSDTSKIALRDSKEGGDEYVGVDKQFITIRRRRRRRRRRGFLYIAISLIIFCVCRVLWRCLQPLHPPVLR
jgi:hypothetical protein